MIMFGKKDGSSGRPGIYTIGEIAAIVGPIAERYGTGPIWLFGSYSRGEATEDSDIDLLVVPGEIKGYLRFIGFYQELEEVLGKSVDAIPYGDNGDRFMNIVEKDMVLIYGADDRSERDVRKGPNGCRF